MIFMSRKDYLFFSGMGCFYKQKGEVAEKAKKFEEAGLTFSSASEFFGRAIEVAKCDGIADYGKNLSNMSYCKNKAEQMQDLVRDQKNSLAFVRSAR